MEREGGDEYDGHQVPRGPYWIEIQSWDWKLSVLICSEHTPPEHRFQGGLSYVRGFEICGRLLAPPAYRDRAIRVWISPFGPELRFDDQETEVGLFYPSSASDPKADLRATLLLPESAIAPLIASLGSVSKYLVVKIFDAGPDQARIDHYAFSSTLPADIADAP